MRSIPRLQRLLKARRSKSVQRSHSMASRSETQIPPSRTKRGGGRFRFEVKSLGVKPRSVHALPQPFVRNNGSFRSATRGG
jgi:hypothetical protein